MSKDFRHGQKQVAKTRQSFHESAPREVRIPSEQRIKNVLRQAIKLQDDEVFEDYNERDIRP